MSDGCQIAFCAEFPVSPKSGGDKKEKKAITKRYAFQANATKILLQIFYSLVSTKKAKTKADLWQKISF